MTLEEKRVYARGYNAGRNQKWPAHKPPRPPDKLCASVFEAAANLRDVANTVCATLDETDEFVMAFSPVIDEFDSHMAEITKWLLEQESRTQPRR